MTAVEEFWGETVLAGPFATLEDSELSLQERALRYPGLYDLMPVDLPGKVVLDYGCGPGHDTILFKLHGARFVFSADISPKAIDVISRRLPLHGLGGSVHLITSETEWPDYPVFDHIHCAGVLHHIEDPVPVLELFRPMLKHDGECRIMVYDGDRSEHTQSDVPVTHWWGADDITQMAAVAGFSLAEYLGGYDCSAPWRPNCQAACWKLT